MERDELNRAAEHMLSSYSETADYSHQFRDDHGITANDDGEGPPSSVASPSPPDHR
ncbi:MAG: hypothetical protein WKF73_01165 [Nocardioidaceae bacterium]